MSNRSELIRQIAGESRRHYAAWTLFNQAMADHLGLHPTDLQCLGLLELESEPLSTGEIAKLTGLTSGSATRLVDRLAEAGLIVRQADPADRRRSLVALAPGSLAEIGDAWEIPGSAYAEVLEDYTEDELAVIRDYLRRAADVGRAQATRLSS